MSEQVRKARGPKPRPRAELKRNSITFRALDDLRSRLMVEAERRGRSLSEEVEERLEQSLAQAGDPDAMLGATAHQVALSSRHAHGCSWSDDKVFATYLYTRLCIVLAARMGVPVMSGIGHDLNFTVPGYEPSPEMLAARQAAVDMAWAEERGEAKRPSFSDLVATYRK